MAQKKKLTNDWKETLHLELAADERGMGATHVSLAPGASKTVDAAQISEQILHLAGEGKKRRIRRKSYLKIEDIEIKEPVEMPDIPSLLNPPDVADVEDLDNDEDDEDEND